jgi:putative thioredoxin
MEQVIGGSSNGSGASAVIKDTTAADFAVDVLDASQELPIIVDFWAPWCGPCKQLTPVIEKAVAEARGLVRLVKLNIDEAPQIAQQMRIQSIPAVYAFFQGRPVDGFMGAVPESQVKTFIERLVEMAKSAAGPTPIDDAMEQAKAALDAGDASTAGAIYSQVLQQEPDNVKAMAGMGRCYITTGQIDGAEGVLASIPEDKRSDPDVTALQTALELAVQAQASSGALPGLIEKVAADPTDHQARFDMALAYYAQGDNAQAIDALVEILRKKRDWNEGAAKEQLVKIFEALGDAHPDTVEGRQKMASVLFA